MEDWTDIMYVSMYGCDKYHYGNDQELFKCENPDSYGMVAAICAFQRDVCTHRATTDA